jgi:hypothetical protein
MCMQEQNMYVYEPKAYMQGLLLIKVYISEIGDEKLSHYLANMGCEVPEIKLSLAPWWF